MDIAKAADTAKKMLAERDFSAAIELLKAVVDGQPTGDYEIY